MKIAAIIAEYNPFHNGHQYQITETRKNTGADYIVAVMSGDFLQRGGPALCNKYIRTHMALSGGVDAVIELPCLYAVSSAEYFAGGSIALLNQLGAIDILSFGSEAGDLSPLMEYAHSLCSFNESQQASVKKYLQEGYSFPYARSRALSSSKAQTLLSGPNNILGLEYCKALLSSQSSIQPFTLKRQDTGYHHTSLDASSHYASASALRDALCRKPESAAAYMPDTSYQLLCSNQASACTSGRILPASQDIQMVNENDFSGLLHYKLLSEQENGFSQYLDCNNDLSDKILKNLPDYTGFSDFCRLLKSKDLTYSRISRVLIHILLNIKTPPFFRTVFPERELFVPYARLLGFRKSASPLLSKIKSHSSIPLISKPANASSILNEDAFALFRQDIYCASVYESVQLDKFGKTPLNEWKCSPLILP
ncbi:MAG: nucleotidyltransferase family protein [Lachnospiraceae bacterium]|nr:nucleotidyltransferase family protein [Lachnospiraceae bacterium]